MPELSSRAEPGATQVSLPAGEWPPSLKGRQLSRHAGQVRPGDWQSAHLPTHEDPWAPQQRLQKQLAEHLRQSWGPAGAST